MVHHPERIIGGVHMQPGEVAPRTANCIENPALALFQEFGARQLGLGDSLGSRQQALRHVVQAQAAERQRDAVADCPFLDIHEFKTAAAKVAGDAVRLVNAETMPSAEK
jgi:hypothetical protein